MELSTARGMWWERGYSQGGESDGATTEGYREWPRKEVFSEAPNYLAFLARISLTVSISSE